MANELTAVARTTKYPTDAFEFVQRGLEYTVTRIHNQPPAGKTSHLDEEPPSRHVTGQDLCEGLRLYAIAQYGLLARTVLRRWNITTSQDFGQIVFAMVDAGLMHKTPDDSINDFTDVFDFAKAFANTLSLSDRPS